MGVSTPQTLFSVYKDSFRSSLILRILYVSQQKYVEFYFVVTHFCFWCPGLAVHSPLQCRTAEGSPGCAIPIRPFPLPPRLPVLYPTSLPCPSHTVLMGSSMEWCPRRPLTFSQLPCTVFLQLDSVYDSRTLLLA